MCFIAITTVASTAAVQASRCRSTDHVIPRSRGGLDDWDNITTACLSCNVRKGNRTPKEAEMPLKRVPRRPLSSLSFEATRQIHAGHHGEWAKYVIGA